MEPWNLCIDRVRQMEMDKLWDAASVEKSLGEFSRVAKQAFEEEDFKPASVEQVLKKLEKDAESSWDAMDAAEEEQLKAVEAYLRLMDCSMAEFESQSESTVGHFESDADAHFDKLSKLTRATQSLAEKMTAAAAAASKKHFQAAIAWATSTAAEASARKSRKSSSNGLKSH